MRYTDDELLFYNSVKTKSFGMCAPSIILKSIYDWKYDRMLFVDETRFRSHWPKKAISQIQENGYKFSNALLKIVSFT